MFFLNPYCWTLPKFTSVVHTSNLLSLFLSVSTFSRFLPVLRPTRRHSFLEWRGNFIICFLPIFCNTRWFAHSHYFLALFAGGRSSVCKISEFGCRIGKCISSDKFCDGVDHCGDGSDEPRFCTRKKKKLHNANFLFLILRFFSKFGHLKSSHVLTKCRKDTSLPCYRMIKIIVHTN